MADLSRTWRRARRRVVFLGVQALLRAAGPARANAIGTLLGELQYRFAWRQRRRIQRDMAAVLGAGDGDGGGHDRGSAALRHAYRANNAAVVEILSLFDRRRDETQLAARCDIEGLDTLRIALQGGRGAILLAAHMGNVALLPVLLAHAGWPVSVVYRGARMQSAGFLQRGLERYGIQPILANAGIRAYGQMLAALRQGRVLFVMLDQGVRQAEDGVVLRFLGKDMPMPAGPAQLARVARAPVLPVATVAAAPRWRFVIGEPVALAHASVQDDLQRLVGVTEQQVRQHPELWSWHHRRWRKYPLAHPPAHGHG